MRCYLCHYWTAFFKELPLCRAGITRQNFQGFPYSILLDFLFPLFRPCHLPAANEMERCHLPCHPLLLLLLLLLLCTLYSIIHTPHHGLQMVLCTMYKWQIIVTFELGKG